MTSQTIAAILRRHEANTLLNATLIPSMARNEHDLSADELPVPLDERIIASTTEALEAGQTHYVDVPGIGPLREAIARDLLGPMGTAYQTSNVVVTAGMQEARFLTTQMIGELYESIGVPTVTHPGVRKALGVRARTIVPVDVSPATYLPTLEAIRSVLDAGCRLLYLESPSRLTGAAWNGADVAAIAELLRAYDAAAIWDQGLSPWLEGDRYASLAAGEGMTERVAVIGELWPGAGLASWFIGYIAAPDLWRAAMQSQKQIMAICTSTPAQFAALEAGKLYPETHPARLRHLSERRRALADMARGLGLEVIEGATATILALRVSADAASRAAANGNGATLADGRAFGAPNVMRLSVSHSPEAEAALKQLA